MSQTESCRYQKEGLKSQANKKHPAKLDFYYTLCHSFYAYLGQSPETSLSDVTADYILSLFYV